MAEDFIAIKVESEPLRQYLRDVPLAITRGMAAAAQRAGARFLSYHKRQRLSAQQVSSRGPLAATGAQQSKVGAAPGRGFVGRRVLSVSGNNVDDVTLSIKMPAGIAALHEFGGTQRAKGGESLLVPMKAALDARGKPAAWARRLLRESKHARLAATQGFALHRGKRQLRELVRIKSKKTGQEFIARVNPGKKGRERLTLLWRLEPEVRVKARLELYRSWQEFAPKAMAIYRQALPYAIRAAGRKLGQAIPLPEGLPE